MYFAIITSVNIMLPADWKSGPPMAEMGSINITQHPQEAEKQIAGTAGAHLLQVCGCSWNGFSTFTP